MRLQCEDLLTSSRPYAFKGLKDCSKTINVPVYIVGVHVDERHPWCTEKYLTIDDKQKRFPTFIGSAVDLTFRLALFSSSEFLKNNEV